MRPHDAGVGEEYIQSPVLGHCFIDHLLHGPLVRGVELPRMDLDGRVQGVEFLGMGGQVLGVEIADVDCEGAVAGELVGAGAADAEGGVGAGDDDDETFGSSGRRVR